LELRSRGGWQRERCRDGEPAQWSEHDTPPAAQNLTPPRLHYAKRIEKRVFELRFSPSFSLSVALETHAALRFSFGEGAEHVRFCAAVGGKAGVEPRITQIYEYAT
jgi:hypothetical protein